MPEQLWVTEILNHTLAGPVAGLMRAVHIEPANPQAPISNAVAMQFLVFVFLLLLFLLVRSRLSVEQPKALQHIFEGTHQFIEGQSEEIIGHHSERFTPFLVTLALFILTCNLIGLIPGFESPTAVPVVPLGCATAPSFITRPRASEKTGLAYLKHFMGPIGGWPHHVAHRNYQPPGSHALAHRASVREYVCG